MSKAKAKPSPSAPVRAPEPPSTASGAANVSNANKNLADQVAGPASAQGGRMDVGGAQVAESSEAGGYYCEHTLFSTLEASSKPGSSVVQGQDGALAGFLHVPDDEATYSRDPVADQAQRHEQTRRVVGAALRGYFDQISLQGGVADGDPFRILVTGYGSFMDEIRNNPTGDFVAHEENLTAAMQQAFGAALVGGPEQVNVQQTDRFLERARQGGGAEVQEYYTATWRYRVEEPATLGVRDVLVTALRLPVTDQAIDPASPGSVQDAMAEFGPQAVLSMGVVPDRDFSEHTYRAETRADDQNLATDQERRRHEPGQAPTAERASRGLASAIRSGSASLSNANRERAASP